MAQKIIILLCVYFIFIPDSVYADCNPATDIKENANGTFTYSLECHIEFGEIREKLELAVEETKQLRKTIELKDLALTQYKENANLWRDTSFDLERRLTTMERLQTTDRWIHFGLGVLATGLSVWAAEQVYR